MLIGTPSAKRYTMASQEKTGESYMMLIKRRAGLWGVMKPQDVQKANALWKMKAGKNAGEEFYEPKGEDHH